MKLTDLGVVLEKTDLEFENQAVLNPACIFKDGMVHMFYRAVRQGNYSSIGYCQLRDNKVIKRLDKPVLFPEFHFERHGVEDPRVVEMDGLYYMFYTAYDGQNAHAAYATSSDMVKWTKQGTISPSLLYSEVMDIVGPDKLPERYYWYQKHYEEMSPLGKNVLLWEKDVALFPKKFNGKYMLLHRIMPGIQCAVFENFSDLNINFWKQYLRNLDKHIVMDPLYWFESRKIGVGCPPIETPAGWLLIYHGVEDNPAGRVYHAAAALLDINDPSKVIFRLPEPLFSPVLPWEKIGDVPNVVFPTGAHLDGDELCIYYGAADSRIMAKSVGLSELLAEIQKYPEPVNRLGEAE